jgi:hypothetical protein
MGAVMLFAGAWGYLRLLKLPVAAGQAAALPADGGSLLSDRSMLLGLAALIATAVLAGLLVVGRRISPLAAGLPGVLLLGWTALYLVSVRRAVEFIPLRSQAFGAGWEALLFNGILGAVGAVMVIPLFIPSRWRDARGARGAGAGSVGFEVDGYLSAVRAGAGPRPDAGQRPDARQRLREDELVGTVLGGGGSVRPVDTTRVTGASRALRATGSFSNVPGTAPHTTGSMPRATGSMPRTTGSFRPSQDTSLLGRPYYQNNQGYEETHE